MRKLATVRKISALLPIAGADFIEAAVIDGWEVVVKKGQFAVGDLCVYFEIDSFVPGSDPRYAAFSERFITWEGKQGMRVKTVRLRKQLSQGLVMPLSDYPEISEPHENMDVTDILKIEKWEPAEEKQSNAGGANFDGRNKTRSFPFFIRKTDQERVQNRVNMMPKFADHSFEVSIKLDGSSMTVYYVSPNSLVYDEIQADVVAAKVAKMNPLQKLWYNIKSAFGFTGLDKTIAGVCSRNVDVGLDGDNHFSQYVREHGVMEALENYCEANGLALAIQGELVAPSIQENYEKVDKPEFYVYSIFNIDAQEYMLPAQARLVVQDLGLNYVPVLEHYAELPEGEPAEVVKKILEMAEGPGMNPGVKREGCVFKSEMTGESFKAISNFYLLQKEKKYTS